MKRGWFSVFLFVFLVIACQKSDLKNMEAIDSQYLPDEISKDVHLVYSDSGYTKFILDAPLIYKYTKDTNYTEFPEGVHGMFFNRYGEKTSDLKAGYCLKIKQDEEVIFRKDVVLENYKNEKLMSEELYLIRDSIFSDTVVKIRTAGVVLEGVGLVASKDLSFYKILYPTGVYYYMKEEGEEVEENE